MLPNLLMITFVAFCRPADMFALQAANLLVSSTHKAANIDIDVSSTHKMVNFCLFA